MDMRRILAATALAATAIGSGSAQAQSYYMRAKIAPFVSAPAPAITYTPVYGTPTACSGNSQTATLASCAGSDGKSYPADRCGPQTKESYCVAAVCRVPTIRYWEGPAQGGTRAEHSKADVHGAYDAQTYCNQQAAIYGKAGACLWDIGSRVASYVEYATAVYDGAAGHYATICK